ncbi:MAG: NAD(P)H-binding protein [Myxococcales bacterium]|nr:NAD(P)H-binding protein [Myxococcales bacterium]
MARLCVLGATGRTGQELVAEGLRRGHAITTFSRSPVATAGVRSVVGSLDDASAIDDALVGCDVVCSALGSRTPTKASTVCLDGVRHVVPGMERAGLHRLLVISALPLTAHKGAIDRLVHPLLWWMFGGSYRDLAAMEAWLQTQPDWLSWTVYRPPGLLDGPATAQPRRATDAALPGAWTLRRSELAAAILDDCCPDPDLHRATIAIAR